MCWTWEIFRKMIDLNESKLFLWESEVTWSFQHGFSGLAAQWLAAEPAAFVLLFFNYSQTKEKKQ